MKQTGKTTLEYLSMSDGLNPHTLSGFLRSNGGGRRSLAGGSGAEGAPSSLFALDAGGTAGGGAGC